MPYSHRYTTPLEDGVSSLEFTFGSQNKKRREEAQARLWALPSDIRTWMIPAALTGAVITAVGRDRLRLVPSGPLEVDGLAPLGLESITFSGFESRTIRIEEVETVDPDCEVQNSFSYDSLGRSTSIIQESLYVNRSFYATVRWGNGKQVITVRRGEPEWIGLLLCRAQSVWHILSPETSG